MSELRVLIKGDMKISWNRGNEKEVTAAREIFNSRLRDGWAAFREKIMGDKGDRIRTFDPDAQRIVLIPPYRGG